MHVCAYASVYRREGIRREGLACWSLSAFPLGTQWRSNVRHRKAKTVFLDTFEAWFVDSFQEENGQPCSG